MEGGAKKGGDVLRGSKAVRYEPDQKTIRGIVFPAIEYIAEYRGVLACIDPAESAQVKPLMRMPQRVFSCPAPDAGVGCCRS